MQVILVGSCCADCEWKQKGITVNEGEVVGFIPQKKFTPKKVKICEKNGKLKYKPEEDVAPGYKIACNGINTQNTYIYN